MPSLRCGCGTTINLFKVKLFFSSLVVLQIINIFFLQGLKELADTEILSEAANTELEKNNLEQAQLMFTQLLQKYDSIIAPPYPVNMETLKFCTFSHKVTLDTAIVKSH